MRILLCLLACATPLAPTAAWAYHDIVGYQDGRGLVRNPEGLRRVLLTSPPESVQSVQLAGECDGMVKVVFHRSLRAYVTVAINRIGQVVAIHSHASSTDRNFNHAVDLDASQAFIRTSEGRAIPGLYRLRYVYDAHSHAVSRTVELVARGGVDPNARGLAQRHCHPRIPVWRGPNVRITLASPRMTETPFGPRIELDQEDWTHPFSSMTSVTAVMSPMPSPAPPLNWRISSSTFVLDWPTVHPPQTPPPFGTLLAAQGVGKALLTVTVGAPVGKSISIPVYSYAALNLGCDFRATPAYAFAPDRAVHTPAEADIYLTAPPATSMSSCQGTPFAAPPGTPAQLHLPYGGVVVRAEPSTFASITGAPWEESVTAIPAPLPRGILLFRTRTGRIVKMIVGGRYEVSDPDGTFPF